MIELFWSPSPYGSSRSFLRQKGHIYYSIYILFSHLPCVKLLPFWLDLYTLTIFMNHKWRFWVLCSHHQFFLFLQIVQFSIVWCFGGTQMYIILMTMVHYWFNNTLLCSTANICKNLVDPKPRVWTCCSLSDERSFLSSTLFSWTASGHPAQFPARTWSGKGKMSHTKAIFEFLPGIRCFT